MKRVNPEILPVRIVGDKILHQKAEPVSCFDEELEEFIADLTETMYVKDGIGLASPQVGKSLRIFVVDPFWYLEGRDKNPIVLINPEFVKFEGEIEGEEGCLSIPDVFASVVRAEKVEIKGLNEKGETVKYVADGMFARVLQHEYDHLEGILFIDKVPRLKRISFAKRVKELKSRVDDRGINIG